METLLYSVYKTTLNSLFYRNANGELHRTDGPAIENPKYKEYRINGFRHRIDGPAVEYANGYKSWWVNGERHRLDGPAVEDVFGCKEWWVNGLRHRTDGPAVEYADGSKEYWINGFRLIEEEFLKKTTVQEYSMDEIADKLGIPVELLKIKK